MSKKILRVGARSSAQAHKFSSLGTSLSCADVTDLQVIEIIPRSFSLPVIQHVLSEWEEYTHLLFTSQHAVSIFSAILERYCLKPKHQAIAIGKNTCQKLVGLGWKDPICSQEESQEGLLSLLRHMRLEESWYFCLPRSALARNSLEIFFSIHGVRHQICDIYDTVPKQFSLPDLEEFDEILFSSPSSVSSFFAQIDKLPVRPALRAIGPVTWQNLLSRINMAQSLN